MGTDLSNLEELVQIRRNSTSSISPDNGENLSIAHNTNPQVNSGIKDKTGPKSQSYKTSERVSSSSDKTHNDTQYPGDLIDESGPLKETGYEKLDFPNPALFFAFYNPFVREGRIKLHPWQIEKLLELGNSNPTAQHPHKSILVTCNGSGKDYIIIASFVCWFVSCKIRSRVIVTSSSGVQLTSQTENYIRTLCQTVNEYHQCEIFKIRQRYIKCMLSGSEIRMFATDEEGKAEGYHPMEPNAEMAIVVNEGKTVTDEIHNALRRCTGYNYWLEVSTPGEPQGFFYEATKSWKFVKKVTSYDCPHLSADEIEADKLELGEHSALFRSKHLALFTSLSGEVIIPMELVNSVLERKVQPTGQDWPIRIGIDLAAGGDENTFCKVRGNNVIKEVQFKEADTTITAQRLDFILKEQGIEKSHDFIFADDGGIGHSIIDMLCNMGWNIKRIHNQWAAYNKKQFGNRGAENWYRIKRLFEEGVININNTSDKTRKQLYTRRYRTNGIGGRIYLESKKDAIAHGRPSPDRADALILAFTGLTIEDFLKLEKVDKVERSTIKFTNPNEAYEYYENKVTFGKWESEKQENRLKKIYNSLKVASRR